VNEITRSEAFIHLIQNQVLGSFQWMLQEYRALPYEKNPGRLIASNWHSGCNLEHQGAHRIRAEFMGCGYSVVPVTVEIQPASVSSRTAESSLVPEASVDVMWKLS